MTMGRRITVRKSTMVRPAQETPSRRLWLSSLDLVAPRMRTTAVRMYRRGSSAPPAAAGDDEGPFFFDGERMRRALAEALVPFYPVAGRLGHDDGGGRLEINCNGEGVLFVEADAPDTALDDLGDFAPTAELRRLVPAVECGDDVSAAPLLAFQVTYFKCGGVCLGSSMDHYVLDGISSAHFMKSWAQLCRGTPISSPPFIDRTILRCAGADDPPPTFSQRFEYLHPPPALPATARLLLPVPATTPPATAVGTFTLTRADLARLRSGSAPAAPAAAPRRLSTFAVVAAHVWRCATLARGLPPDQPTMLFIAVDGRTRLQHPRLPDDFFGNVVFCAEPTAEAGAVVRGVGAASVVQAELDRFDGDYCRSALDYLDGQPPEQLPAVERRREATYWYNLEITSWVRLPIHDSDFGWGRPVYMGPAEIPEGVATLLPSGDEDGSLSVVICLRAEHMDKFRALMYEATTADECVTACHQLQQNAKNHGYGDTGNLKTNTMVI